MSVTPERVLCDAIMDVARYYRTYKNPPKDFKEPRKHRRKASPWTQAELEFYERRLTKAGYVPKRETAAKERLPPDLVVKNGNGALALHLERETRGFEWNHIIGAMVKMFFVPPKPAPVTFLVIANMRRGRKTDLTLELSRRLLSKTQGVRRLYVALWSGSDWSDPQVYRFEGPKTGTAGVRGREIFPSRRVLPNKPLNLTGLRPAG
jgi:hypothetical protein